MKKNPYKILSSKVVYKNPWIEVREDEVIRPDGKKGIFGTVDIGEGVTILAVNKNKEVYLIKEFYYALGEYGIQTPSGGIEKDETPLQAAKKELLEEAGVVAKKWIPLGFINALTATVKSPQHLFLALDLEMQAQKEKEIEVIKTTLEKAYKMVIDGEITYAPSCVTILKARDYLNKHSQITQ
ncbi:MAG TPA: NUDIX hydrolase [Xanthomonadales bacterium]|nr:NUDIX hydrolase [Xanthomonadales bacterium]